VFTSIGAFHLPNAAGLRRRLTFDGTIFGNVYAQPLYVESGLNGPMIIAVTESNNVYALNASTGPDDFSSTHLIDDRTKQHFIYSLGVDTGVTTSVGQST